MSGQGPAVQLADFAPRLAAARDAHERHASDLGWCAQGLHEGDYNMRCEVCGDLVGSTLDEEPYDFSSARRDLLTVHAYIRRFGLVQGHGDGQWGYLVGYEEVEWNEVGNTVQALEWIGAIHSEDGYFRGLEHYEPGITKAPPVEAEAPA
jgi:hypothetical protein